MWLESRCEVFTVSPHTSDMVSSIPGLLTFFEVCGVISLLEEALMAMRRFFEAGAPSAAFFVEQKAAAQLGK